MRGENGQIVETAVEARAGFLDRPTLAVLIVSTALLIGRPIQQRSATGRVLALKKTSRGVR
jgi:hypothetical protein